jgi:hypothetical protein
MLGGVGRRLLGRHAPHLLAVPCSLLVPRLRPPMSPLLQQERAARHVKGAGAVLKGDQKIRMKKAAMRVTSTEGVYVGRVAASFGQDKLEVLLHDGREVRCKAAGRLQPELTRTPRRLRWVRTGYAYQPPALGTYRTRRAACPQGPAYCTYWVRVAASAVPRLWRYRVLWHPGTAYSGTPGCDASASVCELAMRCA